jgi:hypothetical protein
MKCRHLEISDEAYCNGVPVPVFICAWPVTSLGITPGWVNRQIGGGTMIDHKTECPQCPCFAPHHPKGE